VAVGVAVGVAEAVGRGGRGAPPALWRPSHPAIEAIKPTTSSAVSHLLPSSQLLVGVPGIPFRDMASPLFVNPYQTWLLQDAMSTSFTTNAGLN
jgi:hypothetical protein